MRLQWKWKHILADCQRQPGKAASVTSGAVLGTGNGSSRARRWRGCTASGALNYAGKKSGQLNYCWGQGYPLSLLYL